MDIREFSSLLAVYGGRLDKWPHTHRLPAMRLLERSADALVLLEQARALDADLRAQETATSPDRLRAMEDDILARLELEEEQAPRPELHGPVPPQPQARAKPAARRRGQAALWAGLRPGRAAPGPSGHSGARFVVGSMTGFGLSMVLLAGVGLWIGTHLGHISTYSQQQVLAYYSIDLWLR